MYSFKSNLERKGDSKNKLYLWIGLSPITVSAFIALTILFFFTSLPKKLPLFYSLPWGESQLASHQQFFILPATIVLIALANLIVSWQLHQSQTFFKKILLASSLITTLILTITFIRIIFIFK